MIPDAGNKAYSLSVINRLQRHRGSQPASQHHTQTTRLTARLMIPDAGNKAYSLSIIGINLLQRHRGSQPASQHHTQTTRRIARLVIPNAGKKAYSLSVINSLQHQSSTTGNKAYCLPAQGVLGPSATHSGLHTCTKAHLLATLRPHLAPRPTACQLHSLLLRYRPCCPPGHPRPYHPTHPKVEKGKEAKERMTKPVNPVKARR